MGHPQPKTPIQTDNSTAKGFINSKIQPKRTKSMDMQFKWLKDRQAKEQFRFYWRSGKENLADYFTKHHPAAHHWSVRGEFIMHVTELLQLRTGSNIPEMQSVTQLFGPKVLQGCVKR